MFVYLFSIALLAEPPELIEIIEPTRPSRVENIIVANCNQGKVKVEYVNVLLGYGSVTRIKMGRTPVPSADIERLNAVVNGRQIETAWVRSCEDVGRAGIPLIAFQLAQDSSKPVLPRFIEARIVAGRLILNF